MKKEVKQKSKVGMNLVGVAQLSQEGMICARQCTTHHNATPSAFIGWSSLETTCYCYRHGNPSSTKFKLILNKVKYVQ